MVRIPRLHKESSVFSVGGIAAQLRVLADRIALVVSDTSTASAVEVTPGFISAVTSRLRITDPEGTSTVVEGGRIRAASLTLGMLAGAVTGAISDATKTATNYISADATGIRIANASPATATTYQHQTATETEFVVDNVSRASISGDGARFGKEYVEGATDNESHMELDYHSLKLIDREGNEFFKVEDLRGTNGIAHLITKYIGDGETKKFDFQNAYPDNTSYTVTVSDNSGGSQTKSTYSITFSSAPTKGAVITVTYDTSSRLVKTYTAGFRDGDYSAGPLSLAEGYETVANGFASHAEGLQTKALREMAHAEGTTSIASGISSHAEGSSTTASGDSAHAEGRSTQATTSQAHAEGLRTTASGTFSHAEGSDTTASGMGSHAEGADTTASGYYSHAEGYGSASSGTYSHAEGLLTEASGDMAHAQNYGTVAGHDNQTAIGKYNSNDSDNAFEIGNGTADDARSNALAVGWDGTITTARDILITSTSGMSNIITAGSGITIDIFKFCQRSNVASILLRAKKSTVTAANTAISVGTIVADRRPPFECAGPGTSGVGDCWVDETGSVKFRSTSQIAANANFYVRVTYPIA